MSTLVAPFYRASVDLGPAERSLFARRLSPADFESRVRGSSAILRQNLRRLFAAGLLAQATGGRLVFVEGFHSNRMGRGRGERFVAGSRVFALLLRLLVRRGLLAVPPLRPLRSEISRCTQEEAAAVAAQAASLPGPPRVIGIAGSPCPSAARARRYLRAGCGAATVLTPEQALARLHLDAAQTALWDAAAPRFQESLLASGVEAPNWAIHLVSELACSVLGLTPSLELRLAHALRPDRDGTSRA